MTPPDCSQNTDALKLVRDGTSQESRMSRELDPAYAPVDERSPAHAIAFAPAYSAFLKYFSLDNVPVGDWQPFFTRDVSATLAVAAVESVDNYRSNIKPHFDFLNNRENENNESGLRNNLSYLFSYAGTLARQLDILKETLPVEIPLKATLQNRVQGQLAPAFRKLASYFKADLHDSDPHPLVADVKANARILGSPAVTFNQVLSNGLSSDWITDDSTDWSTYVERIEEDSLVYGLGNTVFDKTNHIATHNLFTSIFDQFLKVYVRVVGDSKLALNETLTNWNQHEPHYALFLSFLRLFEYVGTELNTLTGRHLDFYYREVLRLRERSPEPPQAHLLVELAKHAAAHEMKAGELFRAGKDGLGIPVFFANDRDFVANQAKVVSLKSFYRYIPEEEGEPGTKSGRRNESLYASPVANSDDGMGAELTADKSWHPFHSKIYQNGVLSLKMPQAEIGFAVASHYLLMAEGDRTVTVSLVLSNLPLDFALDTEDLICFLTAEKGWVEKTPAEFRFSRGTPRLELTIKLSGGDPAIVPYVAKTHGCNFSTALPILLVKLVTQDTPKPKHIYSTLQEVVINEIDLGIKVTGLRTLAVSNDFGPIDISKPFQPYGPSPVAGNAFIIGSREVFQKQLSSVQIDLTWLVKPAPFPRLSIFNFVASDTVRGLEEEIPEWAVTPRELGTAPLEIGSRVKVNVKLLSEGTWKPANSTSEVGVETHLLEQKLDLPVLDQPDFQPNTYYSTSSKYGFIRFELDNNFGQEEYQKALIDYLKKETDTAGVHPGSPPTGPIVSTISLNYTAKQTIPLNSTNKSVSSRKAHFFHVGPFGHAEQHPALNKAKEVFLLPQFDFLENKLKKESEAEFYIGLTGVKPPQNLALLFQVVDGTADPRLKKPVPHIHWSYLCRNEWMGFTENQVNDQTSGLINSGLVTLAIPRDASDTNTLLPAGMHWIRAAVGSHSDAVCRLLMVAAQAVKATYKDGGTDPIFPSRILPPETINKLATPDASVKKISQPFPSFGGRGAEIPMAFYNRVGERLRHKDRGIALWDYERLVLEAFPQIYKVKCLNHTQYEPREDSQPIYRELAPGHVTLVTIPNRRGIQSLRDPLQPFTSLGLLAEIDKYLKSRISCFVKLHVRNPIFEEVHIESNVRFHDGFDEEFYTNKLKDDATRFLSPWAFQGGGDPLFGGKIHKSALINLVEELPYVDYVSDFRLFHHVDGKVHSTDSNALEGTKAISILVSVPPAKHVIVPIKPEEEGPVREACPCEV